MISNTATRPKAILWIVILIGFTTMRAMVVMFIPTLEMLGGINPDGWLAPWVSDAILGVMAPIMAYVAYRSRGIKLWGFLVAYNAVGAFDYAHGLVTQWVDPLQTEIHTNAMTYGSIGLSMVVQLVVVWLLFRRDVVRHYTA